MSESGFVPASGPISSIHENMVASANGAVEVVAPIASMDLRGQGVPWSPHPNVNTSLLPTTDQCMDDNSLTWSVSFEDLTKGAYEALLMAHMEQGDDKFHSLEQSPTLTQI